jgi:hypothetical protein
LLSIWSMIHERSPNTRRGIVPIASGRPFSGRCAIQAGNRLCLIMEAPDEFSLEAKAAADAASADVQAWERLMWTFQRALPWAAPGEKWVRMERIFSLADM